MFVGVVYNGWAKTAFAIDYEVKCAMSCNKNIRRSTFLILRVIPVLSSYILITIRRPEGPSPDLHRFLKERQGFLWSR